MPFGAELCTTIALLDHRFSTPKHLLKKPVLRVLEQTVTHEPKMGRAQHETDSWYAVLGLGKDAVDPSGAHGARERGPTSYRRSLSRSLTYLAPLTGTWATLSINPAGAIPCCFALERGAPTKTYREHALRHLLLGHEILEHRERHVRDALYALA